MNNYCVYMHISPSGKKYVGITSQNPNKRWKNGKGYKENLYFTNAINKYGWDNFEHIIVAKGLTEDEAKWLEIELIRVNDSANQDKGYNITLGGEGGNGYHHTEEHKQKMREINTGEMNPMFGKHHSVESKKAARKSNKNKKPIICVTTKRLFLAAKEAEKALGVDHSSIRKCCQGKRKSAGTLPDGTKLIWKYVNYKHNRRYRIKEAM